MAKKKVVKTVTTETIETKSTKKKTKRKRSPVKKKTTRKKSARKSKAKKPTKTEIALSQQILENLIELQKVNVNMTEKFDLMTRQVSELLKLFEAAARNFAQLPSIQETEKDRAFLDKIDKLLDQNKTIAKGLTLMEHNMRERIYGEDSKEDKKPQAPQESSQVEKPSDLGSHMGARPLPRF